MNTALRAIIILLFACLFASCQKDFSINNGDNPVGPTPSVNIIISVVGRVIDESGAPVKDAMIVAGTSSAVTDINGEFRIANASVADQAAMVKVEKPGYFTGSRTFVARQNQKHYIEIQLLPKTIAGIINASSGGTVTNANGSTVTLPSNAVVIENSGAAYTGSVQVSMAWINPTSSNLFRQMPGDLRGIDEAGRENNLQSYGMLAVELTGAGGEKLQIAAGKKASLKFPLPPAIQAGAPATIPLWSFSETSGLWKQEGFAIKSGNVYLADVSHFSFWNCDAAFLNVNFSVTFKDQTGKPLSNRLVKITRSGPANGIILTTYGFTDSSGYVGGRVPQNESLVLEVLGAYTCSQPIYTQNIGPYASNTNANLGTITVNTGSINVFTITGTVNNCSGTVVTNGYVNLITANGLLRAAVTNGSFNIVFPSCSATQIISYSAVDLGNSQQSNSATATINSGMNSLGVISACGTTSTEFITIAFNGAVYQLHDRLEGMVYSFIVPQTNIYGQNIAQNILFNFDSFGQGVGSFSADSINLQIGSTYYYGPVTQSSVTYTEYGAINQFIAGTANAALRKASDTTTYSFNCSFRVRRTQ